METKLIELRDEGTTMVVLGIKFRNVSEWDAAALSRAGYGHDEESREWYVMLADMNGGVSEAHTDPFGWRTAKHGRTLFEAHRWLRDNEFAWDSLPADGALIDVRVILGERNEPVASEIAR